MTAMPWNSAYPGILIDPRTFDTESMGFAGLGFGEGSAFVAATRAARGWSRSRSARTC